jgi:leader peptidase (prepilin peptidase)/N-methyltransferase
VGSFLNVVIYRIPAGKSIVRPGSQCACGTPIAWYDNVPVLSWFLLRGRARCCGRPYSFRYPFVELLTAALFLACWLHFPPAKALIGMGFLSVLLCATFIDLDHMIIPDVFTIGAAMVGLVISALAPSLHGFSGDFYVIDSLRAATASVTGLLVGSGLVLWIALVAEAVLKKEAMGFGDVKFVGAIGAFCGWQGAVFSVFGGAIVGTVWFIVAIVWQKVSGKKSPVTPRTETAEGEPADLGLGVHVPFGPMLAIAGAIHFLWAHTWVSAYFADIAAML